MTTVTAQIELREFQTLIERVAKIEEMMKTQNRQNELMLEKIRGMNQSLADLDSDSSSDSEKEEEQPKIRPAKSRRPAAKAKSEPNSPTKTKAVAKAKAVPKRDPPSKPKKYIVMRFNSDELRFQT
jgi:hypothetical protein